MRHRMAGKQLNRTTSHRKAMRRNMAASLIQYGALRTTETKAKELRRFVERIITIAKKGTLHARRRVLGKMGDRAMTDDDGELLDQTVVRKLFDEIAPRYADRPGGYTRIIRLDERRIGDAGSQVIIQLLEEDKSAPGTAGGGTSARKRRAAKRHEAAATTEEAEATTGEEIHPSEDTEESDESTEAREQAEPEDLEEEQDKKE